MNDFTRLFDIIYFQKAKFEQPDAFANKQNGDWRKYSTQEIIDGANKVSLSLLKLGVQPGDKIVIVAANRPEWNITDLGILQVGAVNVPVYPTISEGEYKFIFNDAEVKYAFVGDAGLFEKINSIKAEVPTLKDIYSFDKVSGCKSLDDFLALGSGGDLKEVEARKTAIKPEDLATIIYTSGTTGNPKGVMLSHDNVVSNIKAVLPILPLDESKRVLSSALCHIFERMVVYVYMAAGVSIYYAESIEKIADNLNEVKPHFFTAVPRVLEKVYIKLEAAANTLSGWKKNLYISAFEFAKNYDPGTDYGMMEKLKYAVYDKLIYSKWREKLGGNCEGICSGSAALNPLLARVFTCAGIPIMEGYGQTEASPVITVNLPELDKLKIGTVGPVIDGVEVKLEPKSGMADGEGEIFAKGPNVMMGYYKRPDLTAETIVDGWLKTGDVGYWVEYRGTKYLKITDRVKELFKTSGGKYVAPQKIEGTLKEIPYIEQILVLGENQKFVAALIVPNFMSLSEWCLKNGVHASSPAEMVKSPDVRAMFTKAIEEKNANFGHWETVKKFELMPKEWSIPGGELTPTMKVKRKVVMERFKDVIDKIYA